MGNVLSDDADETAEDTFRTLSQLQTCDIVLMHGSAHLSRVTELATRSLWSHVAMIVRHPCMHDNEPLIWESVRTERYHDVALHGRKHTGVVLTPFRERLKTLHNETCVVRRMEMSEAMRQQVHDRIRQSILDRDARPYDASALDFLTCQFGIKLTDHDTEEEDERMGKCKAYFCSQLVAHTLMDLGVLARPEENVVFAKDAIDYVPADFDMSGQLPLHGDARLTNSIHVHL
jgi:hypothetical protein